MEQILTLFPARNRVFRLNYLLAGIVCLSVLAWFLNTVPPKQGSVIAIGIVLISITLFCFLATVIKNVRRCLLWSSGVAVLLILRTVNLTDILYSILLIILLVSVELALRKR